MTDRATPSPGPIDPDEAERLVLGGPVRADLLPLARLVDAARTTQPLDRSKLEPVLSAYREAEPSPRAGLGRRRWLVTKIAAATVGFSLAGTAAAAGVLPEGLQRAAHSMFGPLGVPAPSDSPTHAPVPPSTHPAGIRPGTVPTGSSVPSQSGAGTSDPSASSSPSAPGKGGGKNGKPPKKIPPGQAKKSATPPASTSASPAPTHGKGHSPKPGITHGKQGVHTKSKV